MTPLSDSDLIQAWRHRGDRQALGALFERHAGFAFGTAYAVLRRGPEAEEAVQEAFTRLIAKAASYDPARPFQPWLRILVVRVCLDQRRSARNREARESRAVATTPSPEDPAMQLIDAETRTRLRAEVDALPEELRLPVVLHYQAGCSYEEVAESLGCPEGTVATRLAAARERLRSRLATAGILLAAGISLEDALARTGPAGPVLPPSLAVALQALAATAGPTPAAPSIAPSAVPSVPRKALFAAGALLAAGIGIALAIREVSPGKPPPASVPPAAGDARQAPLPPHVPPPAPGAAPTLPGPAPAPVVQAAAQLSGLHGRITCRETGLPIANAEVLCVFPPSPKQEGQILMSEGMDYFRATTDGDGRYRLAVRELEPYRLHVSAGGFVAYESAAPNVSGLPEDLRELLRRELEILRPAADKPLFNALQPGEDREQDLALSRGWGILAKVLGPDGEPPARMHVTLLHTQKQGGDYDLALKDGRFELGGLDPEKIPPGRTLLRISATGLLPAEVVLDDFPFREDRYHVELSLQRGFVLRGLVRGPDGVPYPGARVVCWPATLRLGDDTELFGAKDNAQAVDADKGGVFEIQGLPADQPLLLWASSPAEAGAACLKAPLQLPAGTATAMPVLDADGEVSGRILDALGAPVPGAEVRGDLLLESGVRITRFAKTAADGSFVLKGLPPGPGLTALCRHPLCEERREGWSGVPVGTRDLEIRLDEILNAGKSEFGDFLKPYPGR